MKLVGALLAVPIIFIAGILAFVVFLAGPGCGDQGFRVSPSSIPSVIEDYKGEQLTNAAAVVNAGADIAATIEAQTLALAAAIGQSNLVNQQGDSAALGIFAAPPAPAWGSATDRLNPTSAALSFYRALTATTGWSELQPSVAINAVFGTADPYQFDAAVVDAQTIIRAFGADQPSCQGGSAGQVNANGWAKPVNGTLSSPFGPREPICANGYCTRGFHYGTDISAPSGTPLYAIRGGTVVAAGPNGSYGNWIVIDHGGGILSTYPHLDGGGTFVRVGDRVTAGQNIAEVGCSGACSGPHLHLELTVDGVRIDPLPFLRRVGVTWE